MRVGTMIVRLSKSKRSPSISLRTTKTNHYGVQSEQTDSMKGKTAAKLGIDFLGIEMHLSTIRHLLLLILPVMMISLTNVTRVCHNKSMVGTGTRSGVVGSLLYQDRSKTIIEHNNSGLGGL